MPKIKETWVIRLVYGIVGGLIMWLIMVDKKEAAAARDLSDANFKRAIIAEYKYQALKAELNRIDLAHEERIAERDTLPMGERIRIFTEFLDTAYRQR